MPPTRRPSARARDYYDDQTNPATVPGIYTKLLDIDKVDLVVSGYGTNLIAPAMPLVMERKLTFMGLFGLANNEKYKYSRYFQISPGGPNPTASFSEGFLELAAKQNPRPKTVALVGADAEFPQTALVGARDHAKRLGFQVVYDKTYPPNTVDYTPIVRAIKATNPDTVFVASSTSPPTRSFSTSCSPPPGISSAGTPAM